MCSETHPQHLQLGGTQSEGGRHGCSVRNLLCSFRLSARPRRKCLFRASVRTEARCGAAVTRPALARGVCFQRFIYGPDNGCPLCWAPAGSRRRTSTVTQLPIQVLLATTTGPQVPAVKSHLGEQGGARGREAGTRSPGQAPERSHLPTPTPLSLAARDPGLSRVAAPALLVGGKGREK